MADRTEQTRGVLATAMVDFQDLRILAEQLEETGIDLGNDKVFLLAQIARRLAQGGEDGVNNELDLIRSIQMARAEVSND